MGKDPKVGRKRLSIAKWLLTVFFLVLGLLTLAAYMEVGYEHQDRAGERYQPAAYSQLNSASQGGNH